jgi:phosphotransferase system enzyme I (PtsI)
MCGEVAGDPRYALLLLALGLEELSMPAGQIPVMKALIRRCSRADAVRVIDEAMKLTTAEEIDRHLRGVRGPTGHRAGLSAQPTEMNTL